MSRPRAFCNMSFVVDVGSENSELVTSYCPTWYAERYSWFLLFSIAKGVGHVDPSHRRPSSSYSQNFHSIFNRRLSVALPTLVSLSYNL